MDRSPVSRGVPELLRYVDGVLNPVSKWHHVVVGAAVAFVPVLVVLGLAGDGVHPERFDSKQVLITPAGADGVRIRETVDEDFGNAQRHGYERRIPVDFGEPTDIEASSPDAPAGVHTEQAFNARTGAPEIAIRIGDPDTTISGQRRYVLSYTLPDAHLSGGQLALDIIGTDEKFSTTRFEVVLAGIELADPTCNVGGVGTSGGCTLVRDGAVYRVVFEPLQPGQGITIGGTITATTTPPDIPIPAVPPRRPSHRLPVALVAVVLGLITAVGAYFLMRNRGRNLVGGVTAADAAFGSGAEPGATRLVTDRELEAMATTEFEAPRGLRPWQGALLLYEAVDDRTVSAWFSDQIAQGVLELQDEGKTLCAGPALPSASSMTRQRISTLLGDEQRLELGSYEPRLLALWKNIRAEQVIAARDSGWWDRRPPGSSAGTVLPGLIAFAVVVVMVTGVSWMVGLRHSLVATVAAAFLVPALVAAVAYQRLLPRRSATGSAAALQAESFRRFLQASEGQHVDWAWKHGLLREYSAWAVALGAAAAWGRAIASSAVPPPEVTANTMPLLMYAQAGSWHQSFTPPSSSGGGSGGFSSGFSGGSVGGGGGGGSSGSW
ncbi:MAG: hypothetical protein RJA49_2991 [Actinomycetota bacterium]|jgi:uncharacterized membrane protein YgcG